MIDLEYLSLQSLRIMILDEADKFCFKAIQSQKKKNKNNFIQDLQSILSGINKE